MAAYQASRPWDSPGKNTGVGCHFLLQYMKVKSESEAAQSCPTLATPWVQPTRLLRPCDFLCKSTGVGCQLQYKEVSSGQSWINGHYYGRGRRQWHPTPVLLPGKSHGPRSLVGCSPLVAKSRTRLSDFTFNFHFSLSCIGEGNGNPLQCSCLENPRNSGAWWAALYGVAQSRTGLKRLSSSIMADVLISVSTKMDVLWMVKWWVQFSITIKYICSWGTGNKYFRSKNVMGNWFITKIKNIKELFFIGEEPFLSKATSERVIYTEISQIIFSEVKAY